MKILQDNKILVVEPNTNNLKVFDSNFQRVLKLEGIQGDAFCKVFETLLIWIENEAIRDSRCMYEQDCFFWFKGGNILSIVDTNTFAFQDVEMIKGMESS